MALVTGGSRGIGIAVALALAEAEPAIAVSYRERGAETGVVADAIPKSDGRAAAFGADVSLRITVQSTVHDIEDRLGPVGILVNNADMAAIRSLDDITEEDFDHTIAVNLKSAFLCTQGVLAGMRMRHWGRIVNISSVGARIGPRSVSVAYSASKAGFEGLTRSYALRLARAYACRFRQSQLLAAAMLSRRFESGLRNQKLFCRSEFRVARNDPN